MPGGIVTLTVCVTVDLSEASISNVSVIPEKFIRRFGSSEVSNTAVTFGVRVALPGAAESHDFGSTVKGTPVEGSVGVLNSRTACVEDVNFAPDRVFWVPPSKPSFVLNPTTGETGANSLWRVISKGSLIGKEIDDPDTVVPLPPAVIVEEV